MGPREVLCPASSDDLAAALARVAAAGAAVVPWGAGTRQHLLALPDRYDVALCTTGLDRILDYTPADLVMTVEAGATLGAVQRALAEHGQWLPWDPPRAATATIGGLLASAASGPLRLAYGTPRDWTLGLRVALGDGRLVKSGAKVVKNVAGYDTHKLHLGAQGTLGVIVEATFKLAPLPASRHTLLVAFVDPRATVDAMEQLHAPPLSPISLVAFNKTLAAGIERMRVFLEGHPSSLVVAARFAGPLAAVERQVREATRRAVNAGARCVELDDGPDAALWGALADFTAPLGDGSLLLRVGLPPGAMARLARELDLATLARGWEAARLLYPGVGLAYARWWPVAPAADVVVALAELRGIVASIGGYIVVEEVPSALYGRLDRWGSLPVAIALMRRLKARWDPAGILNPGRYVV